MADMAAILILHQNCVMTTPPEPQVEAILDFHHKVQFSLQSLIF